MDSCYEEIGGVGVRYEKIGSGPNILLLIPGSIGTLTTDFPNQIDGGLDHDLFTLIGIHLPGWGKSRPPERKYELEDNKTFGDARIAAALMERLGYRRYSIVGWCFGSNVGMLMAAENPGRVTGLILLSAMPYFSETMMRAMRLYRDISSLGNSLQRHIDVYGTRELLEKVWHRECDYWSSLIGSGKLICDLRNELTAIKCPTLIVNGEQDPFLEKNQSRLVESHIVDSQVVILPKSGHGSHLNKNADSFNQLVTKFLIEQVHD